MADGTATRRGVEENTMAILDSSGIRNAADALDDKLSFLEAVRFAALASDSSAAPTRKMHAAVFAILADRDSSLELVVSSHRLLSDLDRRYPRVRCSDPSRPEVVAVLEDAWSPFAGDVDPAAFCLLVRGLAECAQGFPDVASPPGVELARRMALLHYLCSAIQVDLSARLAAFGVNRNWGLLRDSLLSALLASRKFNLKPFLRDCLTIVSTRCKMPHAGGGGDDASLALALRELESRASLALQKLLAMIMELDAAKKEAEMLHLTSRADAVRTPILELIVDELTYGEDRSFPFLLAFSEPKWKLEVVLQYVCKYCSKPSVRTRKSTRSEDIATLEGLLGHLSIVANVTSIAKRIPADELRLLLSHALEAYLSASVASGKSSLQICNEFITVFQILGDFDKDAVLSPVEKEAVFTATAIVSCPRLIS